MKAIAVREQLEALAELEAQMEDVDAAIEAMDAAEDQGLGHIEIPVVEAGVVWHPLKEFFVEVRNRLRARADALEIGPAEERGPMWLSNSAMCRLLERGRYAIQGNGEGEELAVSGNRELPTYRRDAEFDAWRRVD